MTHFTRRNGTPELLTFRQAAKRLSASGVPEARAVVSAFADVGIFCIMNAPGDRGIRVRAIDVERWLTKLAASKARTR